jgi:glycosyltransferase involved in cell wall biosynthesis
VLIPTYNNAGTLQDLLGEVLEYCGDVIVVNDGSTDATPDILAQFPGIHLITFTRNRGKGHALRAGFRKALELGFEHAISLDSDGQHRPSDLPSFLPFLEGNPGQLVIGSRHLKQIHVPVKNRFANRLSSFWFRVETGLRLEDTQSGFRLYPIQAFREIRLVTGRYELELEILVKAAWKGIGLSSIPVSVDYPPPGEGISHFRPFADFMRISLLHTVLVFLGLLYFRPRLAIHKYRRKTFRQILKEDIIGSDTPRWVIAASVAFGIFMGIFPVWGYQLVIGFFLAHLLRLNKAIFFITANISIPPMIPGILYLSYVTGSYVLGEGSWKVDIELNLASIGVNLKQYLTGAIVFAFIAGISMGALSYAILLLVKRFR